MVVSLFNDVIGPVMRGPSSSHCAAALRIGRLARDLMEGDFDDVLVEFDRAGSLPTTHESQGSDMGLFGGLLGWEAADERLPEAPRVLRESGVRIRIETIEAGDPHPNTYRLTLRGPKAAHTLRAVSTGGGMIEVLAIDESSLSIGGDYFETLLWPHGDAEPLRDALASKFDADHILVHSRGGRPLVEVKAQRFVPDTVLEALSEAGLIDSCRRLAPVLPVLSSRSTCVPFTTGAEMLAVDGARHTPLWRLAIAYECARGGLTEDEVVARMTEIVRLLRRSIAQGIAGTHYDDRVLGHQSGGFQRELQAGRLLEAGALNRMILYVTALMEVKSSMGVIVAMPTAGACAALPGAVIAMAEELGLDEPAIARALVASGLIGVFIATAWTFAAEVGGCQAEGGAAAAMAAAGLVTLAGGSRDQALAAASMAMQSMLGLICDPVANRVEAPCLGKNVMAAANALSCANMALAGFDPLIPLDE
ncbi:MAG: L-serine ammonia-lyase, iron-sulfur-dependent, subunit alpha, partial [Verrucomicrobiales bacterium]